MKKPLSLLFLVVLGTCATPASAQGWADWTTSAGDSGAQKRYSNPTDPQADWAPQYYADPKLFIPRVGTGEMSHSSVNRRAIPSGGYSFGFGQRASFPGTAIPPQQTMGPPGQPFPGGQMPGGAFPGGPSSQQPMNPMTPFPGGPAATPGLYSGPNPSDLPNIN